MDGAAWSNLMTVGVPVAEKVLRTVLVYVVLIAGLRIFGKRELGQLNPLDFIVLLLLSNTVQNAIIGPDNSLLGGLLGAAALFIVNDLLVRVAYRYPAVRRVIEGRSEALIREGRVLAHALERNAITREELVTAARKQGIQHLHDVERADLELGGTISFAIREPGPTDRFRDEVLERLTAIERRLPAAVALALMALAGSVGAQGAPSTDVWIVPLSQDGRRVSVGAPVSLTRRIGYDNQPSFTPDGRTVLYTAVSASGQADSWSIQLPNGTPQRLTNAPIGVYSPTVTPNPAWFSVIRVEADSTQRLWKFPLDGKAAPAPVFDRIKPVGYHAWIDSTTLALFVLGSPATLQIADTRTGEATVVATNIGRALVKVPHHRAVNFMQVVRDSGQWVAEYDFATKSVRRLGRPPQGADYLAWTQGGALLTAAGSTLYQWNDGSWSVVADLAAAGVKNITRLAVSLQGNWLAFVAEDARTP
jgi:uncharacterized membrane protein YcaP (DUF421 family)